MIVNTNHGIVQGYQDNQRYCFKGIPYAKAERFCTPQEYHWDGVLDCTKFGAKPIQVKENEGQSEDCLNLNVYTPNIKGKLPVLVEVYGGAFQSGSNQNVDVDCIMQDDQFVYVNINYRVGILGYLYLDDYPSSGNLGLLDQIAALKWISENIKAFGGDPNRITVLGASAGAKSLASILYAKQGSNYFGQMILVSGAYQSIRSVDTARKVTLQVKELLGDDFDTISTLNIDRILEVQEKLCPPLASTCTFGPIADGIVIDTAYLEQLENIKWKGKVMLGSSLHELALKNLIPNFLESAPAICAGLFGTNQEKVNQTVLQLSQDMAIEDAWGKVFSDYMYRTYSYRFGKILFQLGNEVYQYSSCFTEAFHCVDFLLATHYQLPDNLQNEALKRIGQQMRENMISFVIKGVPANKNWQAIHVANTQMIYDREERIEPINHEDVCQNIGEQVYIL